MITQWSAGHADVNMHEDILVELAETVHRHPWWRARALLTIALLDRLAIRPPARVLDAGCGWGVTLELLGKRGYQADGLDISRRALEELDQPGRHLIEADLAQPLTAGFDTYDAVLALDVIEHVDDDRQCVANLGRLSKPGGVVIISVPALPDLFTEFDAVQGHRRRYLPDSLRSAFVGSGLEVERMFWWGAWMVPILRRQRRRVPAKPGATAAEIYSQYLRIPPWPLPRLLRLAFALEQAPALAGVLPTGTSLFAIGRKPV
jgi:SAM-dependent methyltransferase